MGKKIYGIFVAGGSGSRMHSDIPKQFMLLDGVPVLQRTIWRFTETVPDLQVITALPKAHFQTWKDLCIKYSMDCPQTLVAGGITRFHSVRAALSKVPDGALVLIHDGVRPLVGSGVILRVLEALEEHDAVIPAVSVVDALRSTDPSVPDPDRSTLLAIQTPQGFRSEVIKEAYKLPYDTAFLDDGAVAAKAGTPLTYVEGERYNIKITNPGDLEMAGALLPLVD